MKRCLALPLSVLLLLPAACTDDPVNPLRQTGRDAGADAQLDTGAPDGVDEDGDRDTRTDDPAVDEPDAPTCASNMHAEGGECVCDAGFLPHPSAAGCVSCLSNSDCGERVCASFSCRDCSTDDECGALYCGDDGRCTDEPPVCADEGERRCQNHVVQYCEDEAWSDAAAECDFGCNDDTGSCYAETNSGWIGGRCASAADCSDQEPASALCLGADEGFVEGTCSQRCVGICPDSDAADATVTF